MTAANFRLGQLFRPRSGARRAARGDAWAWLILVMVALAALSGFAPDARADNAGFALAPRSARFALDARRIVDVLGPEDAAVRPVLTALAGEEAMRMFDRLARRANAGTETLAREIFEGRIAFFIDEREGAPDGWMFGIEADDARVGRVLRLFEARMQGPGRFHSQAEGLLMRRVGGWLLVTPSAGGEAALESAAQRVAVEDARRSFLGEPLVQGLLADESPVRIFVRHGVSIGGGTTVALTRGAGGLRAAVASRADALPAEPHRRAALETTVVRQLEPHAALVVANPTDGSGAGLGAIWLALVPELRTSPALRSNLLGERIAVVGTGTDGRTPAFSVAWRVDDAEQSEVDQDLYMRGVCCGCERALEMEGAASVEPGLAAAAPAARRCEVLGPFLDRYLGKPFKLGRSVLVWSTVETACGGWQIYGNDERSLAQIVEAVSKDPCEKGEKITASGIGFCHGPRLAAMLRAWRPLVVDGADGEDRVARGLAALSDTLERLGPMRFRYEVPGSGRVTAEIEFDETEHAARRPAAAARGARP